MCGGFADALSRICKSATPVDSKQSVLSWKVNAVSARTWAQSAAGLPTGTAGAKKTVAEERGARGPVPWPMRVTW